MPCALGRPLVVRKGDAGDALNARLGKTQKGKRVARAGKDLRHILMGLLLILAIALGAFLAFLPISERHRQPMEKDLAKTEQKKSRNMRAAGIGAGTIVEDEFGNYRLRAGQLNGAFVARAFPRHSAKSQGLMAEAKGTSEADAIDTLKSLLSERETNRTAARRWEARSESSVATQEEFLEALRQTNLSAAQQSMLKGR